MSYLAERKHPRFEFAPLPLVLSVRWDEPAPEDKPIRVEARNISEGGIKFVSNRRLALFSPIHLSLFDKNQGNELAALGGKVVRVEEVDTGLGERTYGIAVEFSKGTERLGALMPANSSPAT
jgi:hypothetical protein